MKTLKVTTAVLLVFSLFFIAQIAQAATFGETAIQGFTLSVVGGGAYFIAPTTGTIESITFYNSGGGNANAAILAGTGAGGFGSVIAQGVSQANTATEGWVTVPVSASVTSGTGYWLAGQTSGSSVVRYANTGNGANYFTYNNPSSYGSWSTGCGSGCLNGYTMSIYATYAAAGGGGGSIKVNPPQLISF